MMVNIHVVFGLVYLPLKKNNVFWLSLQINFKGIDFFNSFIFFWKIYINCIIKTFKIEKLYGILI